VTSFTIFLVQLFDLESVLSFLDYIVVSLVPQGGRGQTRTWEFGQGAEIETIHNTDADIQSYEYDHDGGPVYVHISEWRHFEAKFVGDAGGLTSYEVSLEIPSGLVLGDFQARTGGKDALQRAMIRRNRTVSTKCPPARVCGALNHILKSGLHADSSKRGQFLLANAIG
jgi:hypothetical protein